jgi:hypothetical protein
MSMYMHLLCPPVLGVPVHNVYFYVLIYSFPFLAACTSLRFASRRFVSYPNIYLARSRASTYYSLDM